MGTRAVSFEAPLFSASYWLVVLAEGGLDVACLYVVNRFIKTGPRPRQEHAVSLRQDAEPLVEVLPHRAACAREIFGIAANKTCQRV